MPVTLMQQRMQISTASQNKEGKCLTAVCSIYNSDLKQLVTLHAKTED